MPRPSRRLDDSGKGDENGERKDRIPKMPAQVIVVKGGNIIRGDKERLVRPQHPPLEQPPAEQGGKVNPRVDGAIAALTPLSRAPFEGDLRGTGVRI